MQAGTWYLDFLQERSSLCILFKVVPDRLQDAVEGHSQCLLQIACVPTFTLYTLRSSWRPRSSSPVQTPATGLGGVSPCLLERCDMGRNSKRCLSKVCTALTKVETSEPCCMQTCTCACTCLTLNCLDLVWIVPSMHGIAHSEMM